MQEEIEKTIDEKKKEKKKAIIFLAVKYGIILLY